MTGTMIIGLLMMIAGAVLALLFLWQGRKSGHLRFIQSLFRMGYRRYRRYRQHRRMQAAMRRRQERREGIQRKYRICPACGKTIDKPFSGAKDEHFRRCHPEYRYRTDHNCPSGCKRYICLVCGRPILNFQDMVDRHGHPPTAE